MKSKVNDYHSSSLGYHTLTVVTPISYNDANEIRKAFEHMSSAHEQIRYHPTGDKQKILLPNGTFKETFTKYKAKYYIGEHKAVEWLIKYCNYRKDLNFFFISATINPKLLIGEIDYIHCSDQSYILGICEKYNSIIKGISDSIPEFKHYLPNRIDYCFNEDVTMNKFGCTGKRMMKLIKRSDILPRYKEYEPKYDKKSHRRECTKYSHYLMNDSVNLNCYWKSHEQLKNHPYRHLISENIIRFEVQCLYSKVNVLKQRIKKSVPDTPLCNFLITSRLLADKVAKQELTRYFNRVVKSGDYYSMKEAKKLIAKQENLYAATKQRLISMLELIEEKETIYYARKHLMDSGNTDLEREKLKVRFNATLRDLAQLKINPVTIPERWRIPSIPGLMTYINLCN